MNRIEPYLQIGNIDLYLQDCISGFKKLEKESVDVVVTSPPYNIGVGYNKYKDKIPTEKYLDWMEDLSIQIKRVLKTDGSFFINIGNKPTDPLLPLRVAFQIEKHFKLQNVIHWIKSIAITKSDTTNISHDIAVGHFKPVVSNRFLSDCHEYIFHFTIKGDVKLNKLAVGVPYQDKSNIGRWKAATQDKRDRGNTWFIPYKTIRKFEERPHPSTFPILLPEMCIKLHDHVERVIDPFVGIGSSALACMKLGVSFAGFDIDKTYLDITYKRLLQFRI